jgi:C1A family cysteine protease
LYSFAAEYRSIRYLRLDLRNSHGARTLDLVRAFLAAGFPVAFGFPVPASITTDGDIPYRPAIDSIRGGQAVVCVGYDNRRLGAARGALLVRNSWGREWGEAGYGWLPYRYVEEQLASDFWTLLEPDWMSSGEFSRPAIV